MARELTAVTAKITGKTIAAVDAEKEKRSAIDEKLLSNARSSIAELSKLTGLEPEDVAERMGHLLEDRGWMTERMQERFMLIELGDLIADSKKRLANTDDENYAGIAKITLGAMQQMADRWDKRRQLVEADIEKITLAHARLFGRAFDAALEHVTDGLKILHPEITDEEISALVEEGLDQSRFMLEEKIDK